MHSTPWAITASCAWSAGLRPKCCWWKSGTTGPGIPPELQERIFEPFFTTKAPGKGLGLGLDNAMRIVRKHRGHLSVKSEPGSTCFRVRLPLDQLQAY